MQITLLRSPPPALLCVCALLVGGLVDACAVGALQSQPARSTLRVRDEPIAPVPPAPPVDGKAALGAVLFHDVRLSHDDRRTCASCHDVQTNGATALPRDAAPDGQPLQHNTPTVFNAALAFRQDWEGDLRTLEEQADASIQSPSFMATSWDELLGKLRSDQAMVARFRAAFDHGPDRASVVVALAAYERTLITPDSRFDRWLRGDDAALTGEELQGYRLFKTVGCVSCHQGVAAGANLFQRTDVFQPLFSGRLQRVRVPSLRNVAITAPYFDDGSSATLDEAVDRMARAQLGSRLAPEQIEGIVAFLKTLTGRSDGRELTPASSHSP